MRCARIGQKVASTLGQRPVEQILRQRVESMTFDQWTELVSRGVCLQSDDNPKTPNRFCDSFDDGFEEDQPSNSSLEKN